MTDHGSLSQKIAGAFALDMQRRAMALMHSSPRIRAAEYLEAKLRDYGLQAAAVGHVSMADVPEVCVHVVAEAAEAEAVDCLVIHDISFDRTKVPGQEATHYDCCVSSYNVTLVVVPPHRMTMQEAA